MRDTKCLIVVYPKEAKKINAVATYRFTEVSSTSASSDCNQLYT